MYTSDIPESNIYVRTYIHTFVPTHHDFCLWGVRGFDTGANLQAHRDREKRTRAMMTPELDSMITREHAVYLVM